jgi:hypothetical protein
MVDFVGFHKTDVKELGAIKCLIFYLKVGNFELE